MLIMTLLIVIAATFFFILLLKLGDANYEFLKKNISVIILYIIVVAIIFIILNNIHFIKNVIDNSFYKFMEEFIIFMNSCSISTLVCSPLVFIIQKHKEQEIIKKYEMNYKLNTYKYYRELLGDISPAILAKIYNKNISYSDQIICVFLDLEQRGILKNDNSKIKVINVPNNLQEFEKLIIKYLVTNMDYYEFKKEYDKSIDQYLTKHEYVKSEDKKEFNMTEFIQLIMIWIIIVLIIFMPAIFPISQLGIFLVISYVLAFVSIPIYKLIEKNIYPIVRTEKALELCAKLNGLKNYFKDFTIMHDKSINDIKIYDDYVLYAIIFDLKGKLNDECNKLYLDIFNQIR